MQDEQALITDVDHVRLRELLEFLSSQVRSDRCHVELLRGRIGRAQIVGPRDVPPGVVTMNSLVRLRQLGCDTTSTVVLCYPHQANALEREIPVNSALGAAMIGRRVGETFDVSCDPRRRSMRIEHLYYQPESAGDFHL